MQRSIIKATDGLSRGLPIRRVKKIVELFNKSCAKICLNRYDSNAYTRLKFLRAANHSMAAHSSTLVKDNASPSDSNSNADNNADANDGIQRADDGAEAV